MVNQQIMNIKDISTLCTCVNIRKKTNLIPDHTEDYINKIPND